MLLSYKINDNTPLYGTTPKPDIIPYTRKSKGDSSNTSILSVHNHTGTHIDAPNHFVDCGKTISDYSLDELVFKNPVIVDCPKDSVTLIEAVDLQHASYLLQVCDCLVLRTGFGRHRSEDIYRTHNPGIAPETILWIRKEYPDIRCIGIDSISISSFQHRSVGREAHMAAFAEKDELGEPLLIIEDMNLNLVPKERLKMMFVLPWQIEGIDSVPCSIVAEFK